MEEISGGENEVRKILEMIFITELSKLPSLYARVYSLSKLTSLHNSIWERANESLLQNLLFSIYLFFCLFQASYSQRKIYFSRNRCFLRC